MKEPKRCKECEIGLVFLPEKPRRHVPVLVEEGRLQVDAEQAKREKRGPESPACLGATSSAASRTALHTAELGSENRAGRAKLSPLVTAELGTRQLRSARSSASGRVGQGHTMSG